jgi:3-oxoacyl-[acyl-carrier protein] reductase
MNTPDRVTLITGASKGIGRACAERLHRDGHHIIGLARNQPADGTFLGDFYTVDLADRTATAEILSTLTAKYDVNGLINNVGLVAPQLLAEIELANFDAVVEVNMVSAIQCAKACLPAMRRQSFGRIVNISTELVLGYETRTAYSSAKAGLISFARTWALELAKYGVSVNAIAPGPVETDLFMDNNPIGSPQREAKLARIPLGRFGMPEDIAAVVAFFMGPDAAFVTGQTVFVCGGSSLGSISLP